MPMPASSPGLTLERMIARRGPAWWSRMHGRGFRALVVDCDGTLAGYATLGRSRGAGGRAFGEIYELYLRPEYQGCGLGRRLFAEARRKSWRRIGLDRLTVWALKRENEIACRFYRAMGGIEADARRGPLLRDVPLSQDRLRLELSGVPRLAPPAAAPQSGRMALTLWFHPLASFCHKALIALDEARPRLRAGRRRPRRPRLARRLRRGLAAPQVPGARATAARGATVAESTAVIEYLDAFHGWRA